MNKILLPLLLLLAVCTPGLAEETSFRTVLMPNAKGKQIKAVLTFSDNDKAVEVRPKKGDPVSVPYAQIEKCSYEYTEDVGGKTHWLQIDYNIGDAHKVLVLVMDRHDYLRILDAVKSHTGNDAEILGNANKRRPRRD